MSITTFDQLVKRPDSQKAVLCEIEPFVPLSSWTSEFLRDLSNSNHTVTNNTAVTPSTSIKKFGSASASFDGSHYLSIPDSDDWDFGSNDFTIRGFVYLNDQDEQFIVGQYGSPTNLWMLYHHSTYGFSFYANTVGFIDVWCHGSAPASTGIWHHVAAVRYGNIFKVYVNGFAQSVSDTDTNAMPSISTSLKIGDLFGVNILNGYLDGLEIVKGEALWTSDFTPPSSPGSPSANTKLFLQFPASVYSTAFSKKKYSDNIIPKVREDFDTLFIAKDSVIEVDNAAGSYFYDAGNEKLSIQTSGSDDPSNHTICAYFRLYFANRSKRPLNVTGLDASKFLDDSSSSDHSVSNSKVYFDNNIYKFNGSSAKYYGDSNYLSITPDAGIEFGTGAFTVEMFVYLESLNDMITFLQQGGPIGTYFSLDFYPTTGLNFFTDDTVNPQLNLSEGDISSWEKHIWHHLAIVRNATNDWALLKNGQRLDYASDSRTMPSGWTLPMYIGAWWSGASFFQFMRGNMAELHISKGIARYNPLSTTYTVPAAAFTADSYSKLLLQFKGATFPKYFYPVVKSAPVCSRRTGEIDRPGGDAWSIGNLVLNNSRQRDGKGIFDDLYIDVEWYGAKATVKIGGERLPYTEYKLAGEYYIQSPEKNFEEISFDLSDMREFLKKELPENVYSSADSGYENLEQGKQGAVKPIQYGLVRRLVPTLIDSSLLKYQVCDHRFLFVQAYDMSSNVKVGAVPVGFTVDNDNGKFTLNLTPDGQLVCDAVGFVGPNLLDNGTFDYTGTPDDGVTDSFTDWTLNNTGAPTNYVDAVTGTTQKVSGSNGVRFHKSHATDYKVTLKDYANIDNGKWYRVVYYAKGSTTGGSGDADGLNIQITNGSNYLQDDLKTWNTTPNYINAGKLPIAGYSDMMGITFMFYADVNNGLATYIEIGLFVGSGNGDVYVDNIEVCEAYEIHGTQAIHICDNHSELDPDSYDRDLIKALDVARPYPLGFIIDKKTPIEDILNLMDRSTFSKHQISRDGKLQILPWTAPTSSSSNPKHNRFSFISMKEKTALDSLRWKVNIGWGQLIAENKWNYESAQDVNVKNIYRIVKEETINTCLSDQAGAAAVAALYLNILKNKINYIDYRSKLKPLSSDLSGMIELTKDRFNKGAATDLEILKITEDWNDNETLMELFMLM